MLPPTYCRYQTPRASLPSRTVPRSLDLPRPSPPTYRAALLSLDMLRYQKHHPHPNDNHRDKRLLNSVFGRRDFFVIGDRRRPSPC